MKSRNPQQHHREIGLVWYLIPLGWAAAAVAIFIFLVGWPELLSHPLPPDFGSAADAFSLMPSFGGESVVPDATRVFREQPAQDVEHVQAF